METQADTRACLEDFTASLQPAKRGQEPRQRSELFNAPLFLLFDNAGLRLARILRRLQQLPRVARLHELVHGHVAACTMSLSMSYKCIDYELSW